MLQRKSIAKKNKKKFKYFKFIIPAIVLLLIIFGSIYFNNIFKRNYWNKDDKLILAIQRTDGDIILSDVDPVAGEIVNIKIPSNLEIETAGNFGKRKIGKIWELGYQEGKKGKLLTSSITNSLNFPVFLYIDESGLDLIQGGYGSFFRSVLRNSKTNISFGDKIALSLFARAVDNLRKIEYNLDQTNIIKKSTLEDGEQGYVLTGLESAKLFSYFSNYSFNKSSPKILLYNRGAGNNKTFNTGKTVEVLGGKVVSIDRSGKEEDYNCQVAPESNKNTLLISEIFGCEIKDGLSDQGSEINIYLGKNFSKFN